MILHSNNLHTNKRLPSSADAVDDTSSAQRKQIDLRKKSSQLLHLRESVDQSLSGMQLAKLQRMIDSKKTGVLGSLSNGRSSDQPPKDFSGDVLQGRLEDCENDDKIYGFTRTNLFKALPDKAQAYYNVLYNDPQYSYKFDSRAEILKYVQRDETASQPQITLIEKDYSQGISPHEISGASSIDNVKSSTELHQHHWRDYYHMHTNLAVNKANGSEAKAQIKALYVKYMGQATQLDDSEVYYKMDFNSDDIAELQRAPKVIRAVLETMYEIANNSSDSGVDLEQGNLSIPVFGPISPSGIGSWAEIEISLLGSFPQGSGAAPEHSANPYWYQLLNRRRNTNAGNQYIRGHLLNDHMGGPARPYNLIPLCSDANMTHFGEVEKKAKESLEWMMSSRENPKSPSQADINSIYYRVFILQSGQERPTWSLRFRTAPDNFLGILDEMKDTNPDPTWAQFKDYVKTNHSLDAYQKYFQMQVRAVYEGDDDVKMRDLLSLIMANAQLWQMEDREVPRKVGYKLVVRTVGGNESYSGAFNNIVPDSARLKYRE